RDGEALVAHLGLAHGPQEAVARRMALLEGQLAGHPNAEALRETIRGLVAGAKLHELATGGALPNVTGDRFSVEAHAERVRQRFADRENFQEWETFRDLHGRLAGKSRLSEQELFDRWSRGRYVTEEGKLRSLAADETRRVADVKAGPTTAEPTTATH